MPQSLAYLIIGYSLVIVSWLLVIIYVQLKYSYNRNVH